MGKKELDQFVRERSKRKEESRKTDWQKIKNEWLEYLNKFYKNVKTWLKDYEDKGIVTYKFMPIDIYEENIGQYKADKLILTISNEQVGFEPVGTILIGDAKGRIDMKGKNGIVKFLLVDEDANGAIVKISVNTESEKESTPVKWQWKIATPPPSVRYLELNRDSFADAVLDIIND
ncbi:hypothetical protein QUF70_03170 [Desulfobacterales bacterium HSG17]|nr:hypothetical protein [Desulfobacterales bacterium HSG17]